ncbi:hypothetical protein GCM10017559_08280 [Streptosporangium longisporum]|uniref:Uncharacterized protein n=1 Tax=Streptosporangium longisporum TaxID=46187 RepID=A0ABN3XRL3_9ACTN
MPTPDDTLAAIDDVITWDGKSDDAAVWTADERQPDLLPGLASIVDAARPTPEAARAFAERITAGMQAFTEALRPVAEQVARTAQALAESPGWQQLIDWANSPAGRAYIEAAERGELEPAPPPCNCLCVAVHRDWENICEHDAVDELVRVSPSVGRVQIPVCGPCRDAQMAVAGRG